MAVPGILAKVFTKSTVVISEMIDCCGDATHVHIRLTFTWEIKWFKILKNGWLVICLARCSSSHYFVFSRVWTGIVIMSQRQAASPTRISLGLWIDGLTLSRVVDCFVYGGRSFAYAGPSNWNSLRAYLRDSSLSLSSFKLHLKTFLFSFY